MSREINFASAILEATEQAMQNDPAVYLMGLGVPDPKGIFGTTVGLQEKYGEKRVMDMPTSENAMTGIAIGSAICGMKPIMTHQRADFFFLAIDQLVNNAAKWHYMFGDQMRVPLVIRLIIGRGWGQGPQHAQSLHSFFAHIPGLKVVMPASAYDAKGLLLSAIEDPDPVVFFEHRWLHNIYGEVPVAPYKVPIGKAKVVLEGSDITIVASSYMTLEGFKAAQILKKEGISAELIDLRSIKPLDKETIFQSIKKTKKLVVLDIDTKTVGFASEIISLAVENVFSDLSEPPCRITSPDEITPTSWTLSNHFYPTHMDIAVKIMQMFKKKQPVTNFLAALLEKKMQTPLDIPDKSFTGPF